MAAAKNPQRSARARMLSSRAMARDTGFEGTARAGHGHGWFTLRITLLTLMLALLLGTVAVIGGVAFASTMASLRELEDRYVAIASRAVAREIRAVLIDPAAPLLEEQRALAEQGLLPLDDSERLAEFF